jgi:hypothetical protein
MATKRKTWREKLADDKDLPRVVKISPQQRKRFGQGTCVIPAPREVDALMRKVRPGKLITIAELRSTLAEKYDATMACPICIGIFAWIAAHAAAEDEAAEKSRVTPYWRTLKTNGELNPKYPGGYQRQMARLIAEGHRVIQKGKRYFVAEYAEHLAKLSAK